MLRSHFFVVVSVVAGLSASLQAQSSRPPAGPAQVAQAKDINIPKIASRPTLEEFLGGHSRQDMLRIDDFRQRSPGDGPPVSQKTAAWIGYDDKSFYAVFVCDAAPGQLRANLSKREDIFSDDIVGLFLDTYHDHQRSYEFFVNPLGIQADGTETDGSNDDFSFDTLWYTEGKLTPSGYVAMMSIPFKSLRFNSHDVQSWGIGLGRFIPTNNESSFWPFITNRINGFSSQLGNATGLEKLSPGRNLQFIPYAAFGHAHFLDIPDTGAPSFRSNDDHRAGLEAKAVIHDSLSLDIALNPDFSQVESDDPQVTVNQRYAVQFPEKRSFFIENNGFFSTPETLFFSRKVINPEYGGRLTGKLGRWNLGLLGVDDRAPGLAVATTDRHYGEHAKIAVVRAQREFAKQSSVGVLLTDREFGGGYNRVASADTRIQLSKIWVLTGQAIASRTEDVSTGTPTRSGGDAFNGSFSGGNRDFFFNANYTDRSEGFRADLGFIPRVNMRQYQQFVNRRWHPKSKKVISFGPRLNVQGVLDHRGVQTDWSVSPGFNLEMARSTYLGGSVSRIFERFDNINFMRVDQGFGGHTEYFKKAIFDWNYSWGTRINYSTPSGMNAFLANGHEAQATVTLRPVSRLKWDEIYFFTDLKTRPDSFGATPAGYKQETIFVNHLIRSRFNYQYSKTLSARVIVDYNATLQNPTLISLDRQKRLTGDVLLTYLIHPGTAFYLGYTDSLENIGLVAGSPYTTARLGFPSVTTQRQFFAKLSYLIRF